MSPERAPSHKQRCDENPSYLLRAVEEKDGIFRIQERLVCVYLSVQNKYAEDILGVAQLLPKNWSEPLSKNVQQTELLHEYALILNKYLRHKSTRLVGGMQSGFEWGHAFGQTSKQLLKNIGKIAEEMIGPDYHHPRDEFAKGLRIGLKNHGGEIGASVSPKEDAEIRMDLYCLVDAYNQIFKNDLTIHIDTENVWNIPMVSVHVLKIAYNRLLRALENRPLDIELSNRH